jgi:hypothetical protein
MAADKFNKQIQDSAIEFLLLKPEGIRFSELVEKLRQKLPKAKVGTIQWNVNGLATSRPKLVFKPERGLYRHKQLESVSTGAIARSDSTVAKVVEDDFYQPFVDWLVNESEDCTKAIAVGGNKFKGKWGTPDVIGKRESKSSDVVKAPTEILSAEIKTDTFQLITAFGQACAYKLFSHRVYIVVPKGAPTEDITRLDSLCQILGLGLVLFNASSIAKPEFIIRVRPVKHDPDMFYVNQIAKNIETELFSN